MIPDPDPNRDPNRDPDIARLLDRLHEFINDHREQLTRLEHDSIKDTLSELEEYILELEGKANG